MTHQFEKYLQLGEKTYFNRLGKVVKIVGLTIESVGPDAKLNDLCRIVIDREKDHAVMAEVVGFRDKRLLLMPFENVEGIGVGCIVENTGTSAWGACRGRRSGTHTGRYRKTDRRRSH